MKVMRNLISKSNISVRLASILLCMTLVSLYFSSGLYARYITSSDDKDSSARVANFGEITIEEELFPKNQDGKLIIIPGQPITKNATVTYTGGETAAYIFVEMTLSGHWQTSDNLTFSVNTNMLSFSIADDWTCVGDADHKYVYSLPLGAGDKLTAKQIIKNGTINVSENITASELSSMTGISISLRAVAAQNDGESLAADIWEQVKG